MNVEQAIFFIKQQLQSISDSPRLDAELLLAMVCQKTRAALFADLQCELSEQQVKTLELLTQKRQARMPMAYILGEQEFWSLSLKVTKDTLIPRPATECLVEWILNFLHSDKEYTIADLGTGCGAIAIAMASERRRCQVDAVDICRQALRVAKENRAEHGLDNIHFHQGDWCHALPDKKYDLIVANPPYIDPEDEHLHQLLHEPQTALVAGDKGLAAIKLIAEQSRDYLNHGGVLVVEHGYQQGSVVKEIMQALHYQSVVIHNDLAGQPRFVTAFL